MKKLILFALFVLIKQVNAQPCFSPATTYPVGTQPNEIISADFNGDGHPDLATTNIASGNVSILMGTGTGTFANAINYPVSDPPRSLYAADINKDGHMDIVTSCFNSSNKVYLLMNTGTGTFLITGLVISHTTSGAWPNRVICNDFNNDGNPDLAVTVDSVSILLGDGTGNFGPIHTYWAGNPLALCSGDYNNDGNADLTVTNYGDSTITVLLGTGTGSFNFAETIKTGINPAEVTSDDFNGDGKEDLAVADDSTYNITILSGTGSGFFNIIGNFTADLQPRSVISRDLNGDGKKDLVVANRLSNDVSVLMGRGDGTFESPVNFAADIHPFTVAIDDFDGDGKLDMASNNAAPSSSNVSVFLSCTTIPSCIAWVTDSLFHDALPYTWDVMANYSSQVNDALWYWGDGTTSTGLYPSHTYATPGWYSICVTAYTSCGDSASTCRIDSIYKTTNNESMISVNVIQYITSTNQISEINNLVAIYPDPATSIISIAGAQMSDIEILNIEGQIIKKFKSDETTSTIDVSSLSRGMYFVKIKTDKGIAVKKFIKE